MLNKYSPGDYVWYLSEKRKIGENPKLYLPYDGPYLVIQKLSDLDYRIQRELNGEKRLTHHDKLKPYNGQLTFKWAKAALKKAGTPSKANVRPYDPDSSSSSSDDE